MDAPWVKAFLYGAFSAASLPLGAVMGAWFRPPARVIAGVMALGAGALVAALTLELVGPALEKAGFLPLAAGMGLGCGAFVLLNIILNNRGAFRRHATMVVQRARWLKRRRIEEMVEWLSHVDIFRSLPPEEIQGILEYMDEESFPPETAIFRQGDPGIALYIIESGSVTVAHHDGGRREVLAALGPGQTFGEMALLTGEPRSADVVTTNEVRTWRIDREDFGRLVLTSPALREAVTALMVTRKGKVSDEIEPEEWRRRVMEHLDPSALKPTTLEMRQAVQGHEGSGAGLAIWLGACLDGVGEALVIGATTIGSAVSLPLIGGVLLANLPESMSSAATMRQQGVSFSRIFWLWMSLTLVTGIASALGNTLFADADAALFAFFEGAAAGGMLAMTAQTMLPEAFEQGGGTTSGVLTVVGFLAAIFVRSLAGAPGH